MSYATLELSSVSMRPPKSRRAAVHALIARAKYDATRSFYGWTHYNLDIGLERAVKDFPELPYPFVWYVYRSRFKLKKQELKRLDKAS
jgi:hypothetical protein